MKRFLVAIFFLLFAAGAAAGAAHPAIWKVQGKNSTVYLIGSVHFLSPDLVWRDARMEAAIRAADVFYFETPLDGDAVKTYIATKGALPPGQSLHALLPPDSQSQLDEGLASLGVLEPSVDTRRPWLVMILMLGMQFQKAGLTTTGVDVALAEEARMDGKPLRYFETIEQQMALIAPDDRKLELESFESFLKDFKDEIKDIAPMMDAWAAGDQTRLESLIMKDYADYPVLRKAMLDDRNKAWVKTLKAVLDQEHGTFLVTVGAGHLVGEQGVPALLREAGYAVTNP